MIRIITMYALSALAGSAAYIGWSWRKTYNQKLRKRYLKGWRIEYAKYYTHSYVIYDGNGKLVTMCATKSGAMWKMNQIARRKRNKPAYMELAV